MVLTVKEIGALLNVLQDEAKAFEATSGAFHRTFAKPDQFRIASGLEVMLQHPVALQPFQRLAAYHILYDLYRGEPLSSNPFLPAFVNATKPTQDPSLPSSQKLVERTFVSQMLSTPPKEFFKRSPKDFLSNFDPNNVPSTSLDLTDVLKTYYERLPTSSSPFKKNALFPIISDPEEETTEPQKGPDTQKAETLAGEISLQGFEPPFIRPLPPLFPPSSSEVFWLNPERDLQEGVEWDYGLHKITAGTVQIRRLMSKALKGTLTGAQQQQILAELEADPKLVYSSGLTPQRLPDLVEHNPIIAIEMLLKLISSSRITEYFSVLVNMQMSLHSMEVVNRLTMTVELPKEFIHLYISNCIQSCENVKDKYMQNRLVRLVCVFLQSLIRNNIVNVSELRIEVQAFCVEHLKTREAHLLYKSLRQQQQQQQQQQQGGGNN